MQTQSSLSSKVTADAPSLLTPHDERVIPSFTITRLHMSSRVLAIVVMACGAPLLVAACGSEPTADEPSRTADNLGTRVCLVNNDTGQRTSEDIGDSVTLTATVAFTRKDTAEEGAFPPGKQLCAEGCLQCSLDVKALSPVSIDVSSRRAVARVTIASAGTRSPALRTSASRR